MNAANALGYLDGAMPAARVAARFGSRRTMLTSIAVTAAALVGSAATTSLPALAVLRLVMGVSGAFTFVIGAGLVSQVTARHRVPHTTLILGGYFAGASGGILLTGLCVPALLSVLPLDTGWRWTWLVLGCLALAALAAAVPAVRRAPEPPVDHRPPASSRTACTALATSPT